MIGSSIQATRRALVLVGKQPMSAGDHSTSLQALCFMHADLWPDKSSSVSHLVDLCAALQHEWFHLSFSVCEWCCNTSRQPLKVSSMLLCWFGHAYSIASMVEFICSTISSSQRIIPIWQSKRIFCRASPHSHSIPRYASCKKPLD